MHQGHISPKGRPTHCSAPEHLPHPSTPNSAAPGGSRTLDVFGDVNILKGKYSILSTTRPRYLREWEKAPPLHSAFVQQRLSKKSWKLVFWALSFRVLSSPLSLLPPPSSLSPVPWWYFSIKRKEAMEQSARIEEVSQLWTSWLRHRFSFSELSLPGSSGLSLPNFLSR